jgi:hypothetical protein
MRSAVEEISRSKSVQRRVIKELVSFNAEREIKTVTRGRIAMLKAQKNVRDNF